MTRIWRVVLACAFPTMVVGAQSKPSFEVATIKRSERLDEGGSAGFQPGGRFRAVNIDVLNLILTAYRMREQPLFPSQVVGAPDWVGTLRYDITAKVSSDVGELTLANLGPKMPEFLQSLLEDRFKLRVHREMQDRSVFALRLLRKDGKLGPQMQRSTARCPDERAKCSMQFQTGRVEGGAMDMATLAGLLSSNSARVVIDQTGLQGAFAVTLEWSPDQTATDKPSLVGAIQEQLGLKLETSRAPVDVVVIDHVERPIED